LPRTSGSGRHPRTQSRTPRFSDRFTAGAVALERYHATEPIIEG
jgi:hypothetical protein